MLPLFGGHFYNTIQTCITQYILDLCQILPYSNRLIMKLEGRLHDETLETVARLRSTGVKIIVSENRPSTAAANETIGTCREIAPRRTPALKTSSERGIPVYRELKTQLFAVDEPDAPRRFVMAHCRGNEVIDEEKTARALDKNVTLKRVDAEELAELGLGFGLINPLTRVNGTVPQHVVDPDLLKKYSHHDTVMTNAGHAELSLEFAMGELINALQKSGAQMTVMNVTRQGPSHTLSCIDHALKQKVGVITGNSFSTGQLFTRVVRDAFVQRMRGMRVDIDSTNAEKKEQARVLSQGDLTDPSFVVFSSGRTGISMNMEHFGYESVQDDLELLPLLEAAHTTILTVPCHTKGPLARSRYAGSAQTHGMKYISIDDSTINAIVSLPPVERERILLLGGRSALDPTGVYICRLRQCLPTAEIVVPENPRDIAELMFEIKDGNRDRGLQQVYKQIQANKVRTVVLAATEFSELDLEKNKGLKQQNVTIVDGLRAYARDVAGFMYDNATETP